MYNPFSEENLSRIFKTSIKDPNRLIKREDTNHEFKESYNNANMAMYFKTIAAFANNEGGYLIFGIKDTPHILLGLSGKSLIQFQNLRAELLTQNLNEYFSQSINWTSCIYEFKGYSFGIIYIYPLLNKPAICCKSYDCAEKKYSLKDADIYYRYAGRSERIKSSDLQNIIEERRKNEEKQWLELIAKVAKIGIQNASLLDLANGSISNENGTIVIDEPLLSQIKFIKEGEFVEKTGAPTLRLIGDIKQAETGKIIVGAPQKIIRAIEQTDIVEAFLNQEDIHSPQDYIKHICSCFSGNLPVYYYIKKAGFTLDEAIALVEESTSRNQGKKKLLERLKGNVLKQQIINKTQTEFCRQKAKYSILWINEDFSVPQNELHGCICAIQYLSKEQIIKRKDFILNKILELYKMYYEKVDGSIASSFRLTICYIDESIYKD